jgi:hypothetical protein
MFKAMDGMRVVDDQTGVEVSYRGRPEVNTIPLALRDRLHPTLGDQYFEFDAILERRSGSTDISGAQLSLVNVRIVFARYTKGDPEAFSRLREVLTDAVTVYLRDVANIDSPTVKFSN